MNKSITQILADTRSFVQAKEAQYNKRASDQALTNPESIPGSAHDKPAPAVSSDPEVKQELPACGTPTDGEQIEAGHTLASGEGMPSVTSKPMVSSDAHAKTAAAHANSLMATIRQFQATKAASDTVTHEVGSTTPAPTGSTCACGKESCDCGKSGAKAAGAPELELTSDVLAKIASMVLATEDGVEFVEQAMAKAAGAEAARELLGALTKEAEAAQAQEAYAAGIAAADEYVKQACYQAGYERAIAELGAQPGFDKAAADAHYNDIATLGYQVADEAIKMAQEAMIEEEGGEVPGAEAAASEMGEAPMDDDFSPEELEQALAMMVAEGTLGPEEAGAVMEYISGAGAVDPAAAGMDPTAGMDPAALEAAGAPDAGMEVSASDRRHRVAALANHIAAAIGR